jgi:hypothetical protein
MPFGGLLPYHCVGGASAEIEPFARVRPEELPCPQLPFVPRRQSPGHFPSSLLTTSFRRSSFATNLYEVALLLARSRQPLQTCCSVRLRAAC